MRRVEVVANHDVWDVLDGDDVVGIHPRKPDALWQAVTAARASTPSRLAVIAADGQVENTTEFHPGGTATARPEDPPAP